MINKIKSEGGYVTVAFLIILPLIMMFLIVSLDHTRSVFGTDLDMQQALNDACRSSAMMVDPLSQAYNDPMIDPKKAHMAFRDIMASNLKLNSDLSSDKNSPVENLEYTFIVFNGQNDYGLPQGWKFSNTNPEGTKIDDTLPRLPRVFNDSDLGVDVRIELDRPGCIAVASANLKPVIGKQESTGVRWSSAKIIK
jgi:hypothetical protein